MRKEELECTNHNTTPARFAAYVRYMIRKNNFKGICAEDIDLNYWAIGNDLNFDIDNKNNLDAGCAYEKSISKPYEMQTYIKQWDGSVFNMIMEFMFDDDKKGTGYFYYINKEN